ncbi:MAG TPA: hypothetical protein VM409_04875, partial [Chloroflexia bacterium]|nr:hypothetical protein [Chloroflexia bacterium]
MDKKLPSSALAALIVAMVLSGSGAQAAPTRIPTNFADEAFKNTWLRTDALVESGSVKRSYYWGPTAGYSTSEEYAEGAGGLHLVQYFDKSRMEINNPNGDKNNPFYVTNGLLTRELIEGRIQTGNSSYIQSYPAEIDLASDTDDTSAGTPTYASFRSVTSGFTESVSKKGQVLQETINRAGFTGTDSRYGSYGVKYAYFEVATRHNIPDKFWDFLNATGPVIVNGKQVNARLSDPYFYVTGLPLSEAYWASVKIAGVANTPVLIQPYERRVLTYVPSAPNGFKVQMGNIGLHYYDWRYRRAGNPPPPPLPPVHCDQVPIRGFGKVWADHPEVQVNLGCMWQREEAATVSHQYFEHGEMLGVLQRYNPYSTETKVIYVLFGDHSVQRFQDTYVDGDPEPQIAAPPGLYAPAGSFGKLWREGTGARVRERLGWAT